VFSIILVTSCANAKRLFLIWILVHLWSLRELSVRAMHITTDQINNCNRIYYQNIYCISMLPNTDDLSLIFSIFKKKKKTTIIIGSLWFIGILPS